VAITKDKDAQMQYKNFEHDIVIQYGVDLVGWTHSSFKCPSKLSTSLPPLQTLLDALNSGTCHFKCLSKQEHAMRKVAYQCKLTSGEIAPRKPRSDIGCRRKHGATKAQKAKRSRRTDSDSESDSSSSRKDDNN
ncbi:hypothetical protein FOMPIDRAFT_1100015, partial [Fomitopsis schrenkii]